MAWDYSGSTVLYTRILLICILFCLLDFTVQIGRVGSGLGLLWVYCFVYPYPTNMYTALSTGFHSPDREGRQWPLGYSGSTLLFTQMLLFCILLLMIPITGRYTWKDAY